MEIIKTSNKSVGRSALLARLMQELSAGKKVLWLLSGGSAISSTVEVLQRLIELKLVDNLTVMLMDERYGNIGHDDSNWKQLQDAGCDFSKLHAVAVMTEPLGSFEDTVTQYAHQIGKALAENDVVVGLFGIGPDGHTAGILPESLASQPTDKLVIGYHTPQFDRITTTKTALLRVNVGFVFAYGDAKAPALTALLRNEQSFEELPSVLLHELPEVYVYNDQVEGGDI